MRITIAAVLMFLFWFILSGHTELWLILLGLLSVGLSIFLSKRMNIMDREGHPFHLTIRLLHYFLFLGEQILIANLDVVKRILKPGRTTSPQIIQITHNKKTNLGKVIYANSITLTPGTVTLELTKNNIKVHALSQNGVDALQTGQMANRVPDDETPSS